MPYVLTPHAGLVYQHNVFNETEVLHYPMGMPPAGLNLLARRVGC